MCLLIIIIRFYLFCTILPKFIIFLSQFLLLLSKVFVYIAILCKLFSEWFQYYEQQILIIEIYANWFSLESVIEKNYWIMSTLIQWQILRLYSSWLLLTVYLFTYFLHLWTDIHNTEKWFNHKDARWFKILLKLASKKGF